MKNYLRKRYCFLSVLLLTLFLFPLHAQVTVGDGSYATQFPGTDSAGRNGFPSGSPQTSGTAANKPIPTNDWWSKLIKENHADNLFNYPLAMKTTPKGLIISYIPWGVYGDLQPLVVGTQGLNASRATISKHTDWTATMEWNDGAHQLKATSGIGMPFVYFTKKSSDVAEITINEGTVSIVGNMITVENSRNGADYAVYAPAGSSWQQSGKVYRSRLNNKNYFSVALLPQSTTNVRNAANNFKQFAFAFPQNTKTEWSYNEANGQVTTNFSVTVDRKEGSGNTVLLGLLPHQWAHLAPGSPQPNRPSYSSVRGELKMLAGNSFSVRNTFKGILPTMPYLAKESSGFNPAELNEKIKQVENDGLSAWTDSYNEGQMMNRLIQTARIADQTGNILARDKIIATVKDRLENWLSYQSGEVAFLFYYNDTWSALLGYPAGHGQDNNINDHHFHWGYFIHAAAFMEQFEPGWASRWGGMVNKLVDDAANRNRNDNQFPFLRNFSPYAGHCWANGFATFPQGNDQESTSESMQFNSSLIHWGSITNNNSIRDLGVYLYTTEQTAIEEYWFDQNNRTFRQGQKYGMVSRVWGNSYDNGTFWTDDITASYVIELYPMHGGSLYLGQNKSYVQKIWNELQQNTAILDPNSTNPNLWYDTIWKYLSFLDPAKAIELYNQSPNRNLKFGVSDAQTYHWLHAMNAMGTLETGITANYPIAAVFSKNGVKTYVAHNYSNTSKTVTFSDGFRLNVPAGKMATNRDADVFGTITSNEQQVPKNGNVELSLATTGSGISKVQFFDGDRLLGEDTAAPYQWRATNLSAGIHGMYAKIFKGNSFNISNIISIQSGEQAPYSGTPIALPGSFEAAYYDTFEGGPGQNVSYVDLNQVNEGKFRPEEYVDAILDPNEGATVGWIVSGEWLEYTVNIQNEGTYDLDFRYASGNPNGGGPIYFEIDGSKVGPDIPVASTGDWSNWVSKKVTGFNLPQGKHVLRLSATNGELNIGKITFTFSGVVPDNTRPVADAGQNQSFSISNTVAELNASASSDADGDRLAYSWAQINGPSNLNFSNASAIKTNISNFQVGTYEIELTVDDGKLTATDRVIVTVTEADNNSPSVSITSPSNGSSFEENQTIAITANASDDDGSIAKVSFYNGNQLIDEDTTAPYAINWNSVAVGEYSINAIATDDQGATGNSQTIQLTVKSSGGGTGDDCTVTGTTAQQGAFSKGYTYTFKTVGTDVEMTFEILDTDKVGLIAYLWKASPFTEYPMTRVSEKIYTATIANQAAGSTIRYACKFAFAGGLAVTEYIDYVVGTPCGDGNGNGTSKEGDGLRAYYYNGRNFENFVFDRIDETIDFDWGLGIPGNGVNSERFSIRWDGTIVPEKTGTYTFYLNSDNGRRLWVNDQLLINQWIDNWNVEYTGSIYLEKGKEYAIKLEYFENVGGANCKLEWSSNDVSREIVPKKVLFSADPVAQKGDGLLASYFNGRNFESFVFDRVDKTIDFNWGSGNPGAGINNDSYSVRWTGAIKPKTSGNYTFYINSDNGRRLWVNNQLIIDAWKDDWNIEYSGSITLEADKEYAIKIEYFENWGGASCKFEWSGPSITKQIVPQSVLFSNSALKRSDDLENEQVDINFYPNPVQSVINISSSKKIDQITVYNLQGQELVKTNKTSFDVSHLPSGYYFMKISSGARIFTKKFIKE